MACDPDLIRSVAEPIVLRLVTERPMYGYEIIKIVNKRTDGEFLWREGTLYPCLHRLEAAGLIGSEWSTAENGKRRKYYRITRKGKTLLKEKVTQWSAFSAAVDTLLLGAANA